MVDFHIGTHTKTMRHYLYDEEVPPDLAKRILHYIRLRDKKMRQEYIDEEVEECISTLSKPLRRRLVLHTRKDLVEQVPWFSGRPLKFVADACPLLKSIVASPLEVVGAQGVSASALVFVLKGDLAAFEHASQSPAMRPQRGFSDLDQEIDKKLLAYDCAEIDRRYTWGPESTFGLPGCVLNKTWRFDIVALDNCEMLSFPKEALLELLGQYDHAAILPALKDEAEASVAEHLHLFEGSDDDESDAADPFHLDPRDEAEKRYACDRLVTRRADVAAFLAEHLAPASLSADNESATLVREFVAAHAERPARTGRPERVPTTTVTVTDARSRLSPREPSTSPRARAVVVEDAPVADDNPADMLCGALVSDN